MKMIADGVVVERLTQTTHRSRRAIRLRVPYSHMSHNTVTRTVEPRVMCGSFFISVMDLIKM